MPKSEIFYLILGFAALWVIYVITLRVKISNRREGWDAHKNGLRFNPAWGKDICRGWQERADGLPRP